MGCCSSGKHQKLPHYLGQYQDPDGKDRERKQSSESSESVNAKNQQIENDDRVSFSYNIGVKASKYAQKLTLVSANIRLTKEKGAKEADERSSKA
jgi:hypothetical protein